MSELGGVRAAVEAVRVVATFDVEEVVVQSFAGRPRPPAPEGVSPEGQAGRRQRPGRRWREAPPLKM